MPRDAFCVLMKEVKETLDRGCRGVRCHEALLGQVTGGRGVQLQLG